MAGGSVAAFPQDQCADASACRAAALDAAARGEFETFHDLAWRAVQKGRPNDPELMLLLARAQSLSGRPGDALVMLRRLAERGALPDVRTTDDFRRVRALPGWPELEALITRGTPEAPRTAEMAPPPAAASPAANVPRSTAPAAKPAPPSKVKTPLAPAPRMAAAWADDELRVTGASLPTIGLAHDSVSRRFIVGDRLANKLVVVDEVFNRVNDLVGAESGGFFGLRAIEIDPRRGDLWVANSGEGRGPSLHKLQLVSGRVLFELPLPEQFGDARFDGLAVTPAGAVLVLDSRAGRLLRVAPGARKFERLLSAKPLEGATSVAAPDDEVAFVAGPAGLLRADLVAGSVAPVRPSRRALPDDAGLRGLTRIRWHRGALIGVQALDGDTHRIVRLTVSASGGRVTAVTLLDPAAKMPDPTAAAIDGGVLFYLTQKDGASVVRRIPLR